MDGDCSGDEVLGSESSSDRIDSLFRESEAEDNDLIGVTEVDQGGTNHDANLMKMNTVYDLIEGEVGDADLVVDDEVEDNLLEEVNEESDELCSVNESDDESKKIRSYPEFNAATDFKKKIKFKNGMIFASNAIFRKALKQYAIENGANLYYLHNDKRRVYVYCLNRCHCVMKHARKHCTCNEVFCGFRVCARKLSDDGTFQLKSFNPKHECGWQHKNTKLTSI